VNTNLQAKNLQVEQTLGVKVYPNPASEDIVIRFNEPGTTLFNIALYDLNGKKVRDFDAKESKKDNGVYSLDLLGLSNGVYMARLYTDTSVYYNYKIVISN